MIKGIEAITSPVSTELKNGKQFYTYTKEDVEAIEKDLKRLEQLEIMYSNCVIEGAKQKKALEIIKNKKVNIGKLIHFLHSANYVPSYKEYQNDRLGYDIDFISLTEEEYDLLKEVLK